MISFGFRIKLLLAMLAVSQQVMAQKLIDKSDKITFFNGDPNLGDEVYTIPLNSVTFYENVSATIIPLSYYSKARVL